MGYYDWSDVIGCSGGEDKSIKEGRVTETTIWLGDLVWACCNAVDLSDINNIIREADVHICTPTAAFGKVD